MELFKNELIKRLQKELGKSYIIIDKPKNSAYGFSMIHICESYDGTDMSLNIPIDDFFIQYQIEQNMKNIIKDIKKLISNYKIGKLKNTYEIEDCYGAIKSNIYYKLINAAWNKNYLKDKFFVPYLDLAIVFYVVLKENFMLPISNRLFIKWNSPEDILYIASENMRKKQKITITPIREYLKKYSNEELACINPYIYNISDCSSWNNSTNILLDTKPLEKCLKDWNCNIVVLPFTKNSLLCIPENEIPPLIGNQLSNYEKELLSGSQLSNHKYLYKKDSKKVEII